MNFIKVLLMLIMSISFSVFSMSSNTKLIPQQTVINFINDYEQWNEDATQNLSETSAGKNISRFRPSMAARAN